MKQQIRSFQLSVLLLFCRSAFSQGDTIVYYFDAAFNKVASPGALYRCTGVRNKDGFEFCNYHHPSGIIIMKGNYSDTTFSVKKGRFTYFDDKGARSSEGDYRNNLEEGFWAFWEGDQTDSVYYEKGLAKSRVILLHFPGTRLLQTRTFYDYKKLIQDQRTWDTAGRLVFTEYKEKGNEERYTYYPNGKIKEYEKKNRGEESVFTNYDEMGKEATKEANEERKRYKEEAEDFLFPHGPKQPDYPGGRSAFSDFLRHNIKLTTSDSPGSSSIMRISFVLDDSGNPQDIKVIGVIRETELKIASVIRRMPSWKMNGLKSFAFSVGININTIY